MKIILNNLIKLNVLKNIDIEFSNFISKFNKDILLYIITAYLSYSYRHGNICLLLIDIYKLKFLFFIKNRLNIKKIKKILIRYFYLLKKLNILNFKNFLQYINKLSNVINKFNKYKITPIIIYNKKIYLYKNWYLENKIINYLISCIKLQKKKSYIKNNFLINLKLLIKILKKFKLNKHQTLSILNIILNKITIIYGKAGTGKSSLIYNIVYIILKIYKINPIIQILSATAKSSIRIKELLIKYNNKIINKINPIITIHKFLNINKFNKSYFYKKKNYYQYIDIIIIDESLMINLNLMWLLFKSIKNNKYIKIILLGDPNQLKSIEVGGILKSLYSYTKNKFYSFYKVKLLEFLYQKKIFSNNYKNKCPKSNKKLYLNDNINILKYNFRFQKCNNIKIFTDYIYNNNIESIKTMLLSSYKEINFFPMNNTKHYKFFLDYCSDLYKSYFFNIKNKNTNIFNILKKHQLLCIMNNGVFGINGLNYNLEKILKIKYKLQINNSWYEGRPIMINNNNNTLNLFNGDIGITYKNNKYDYLISFLINDHIKYIPSYKLIDINTAWSLTIHKVQGLEFEHIILILPNYLHKILNKELIYTALTRAKKKITIFSDKDIFFNSIKRKSLQYTGIKDKLKKYLIY